MTSNSTILCVNIKRNKGYVTKNMYTKMFTAIIHIAPIWSTDVSINRRMDKKSWYNPTMEYYLAIKAFCAPNMSKSQMHDAG